MSVSRSVNSRGNVVHTEGPVATIGSIPMRAMPININVTKDVEAYNDEHSVTNGMDFADYKRGDSDGEINESHTVH